MLAHCYAAGLFLWFYGFINWILLLVPGVILWYKGVQNAKTMGWEQGRYDQWFLFYGFAIIGIVCIILGIVSTLMSARFLLILNGTQFN